MAEAASAARSSENGEDTEATDTGLSGLGLKEVQVGRSAFPKDYYSLRDGKHLARVYKVWGTTLKVVCKVRPACTMMYLEAWCGECGAAMQMAHGWIAKAAVASVDSHYAEALRLLRGSVS